MSIQPLTFIATADTEVFKFCAPAGVTDLTITIGGGIVVKIDLVSPDQFVVGIHTKDGSLQEVQVVWLENQI